ncbi:hypothetical protein BH11PAT2_BH11PAT2_10120 [soil metagenome]
MITNERAWKLLHIALPIAALIILFFSGIFPIENLLSFVPQKQLGASVSSTEVVSLTNENRTEDNLPALTTSALLTQAAQLKADDMAANSYYAHISPDGKTPLYWLERVGYHYLNAGENLVIDRTTSQDVVTAWMNSADHRENILRPQFTEIGVGVAQGVYQGQATTYVVQEFGTPYPNPPLARKAVVASVATPIAVAPVATTPPASTVMQPRTTQTTPTTTFKPQPLPTRVTPKTSNTLVNNVVALATPVTETIQVHTTVAASSTATTTTAVATSSPIFSLPAQADVVVTLPTSDFQESFAAIAPATRITESPVEVGKRRIAFVQVRLSEFWTAFTHLIF